MIGVVQGPVNYRSKNVGVVGEVQGQVGYRSKKAGVVGVVQVQRPIGYRSKRQECDLQEESHGVGHGLGDGFLELGCVEEVRQPDAHQPSHVVAVLVVLRNRLHLTQRG